MAQENGQPTAEEKGKAVVKDTDADKKKDDAKKDKDGKLVDGKKENGLDLPEGMSLFFLEPGARTKGERRRA